MSGEESLLKAKPRTTCPLVSYVVGFVSRSDRTERAGRTAKKKTRRVIATPRCAWVREDRDKVLKREKEIGVMAV
jgi:hypothetical protein